jgi:very-short-patch-repair endonuclease
VLDFYRAEARVAVEIDGMSHDLGDRPNATQAATRGLKHAGLR